MKNQISKHDIINFIDKTYFFDLPVSEILQDSVLNLDLDSLKILSLSFELEKEFGMKINLEKLSSSTTLDDVINDLLVA
jgi:acyl carrier protein